MARHWARRIDIVTNNEKSILPLSIFSSFKIAHYLFNDIHNYKCSSNRYGSNGDKPYDITAKVNHIVLYQ